MKISPLILKLRTDCTSFDGRIGGTADIPTAEEATHLLFPCAIVEVPRDEAEVAMMQTRYFQTVGVTFVVMIYVAIASNDERGLDAYDVADDLKAEVIKSLAGHQPDDCNGHWIEFDGAEVAALTPAYLAYRLTFSCAYQIEDGNTAHGELIANLPPFLRMHTDVVGIEGDPEGKTPIARQILNFEEG